MSVPELNAPEKALKLFSQFKNLISTYYSGDTDAPIKQDDPQALHAGLIGDLASQALRVPDNLRLLLEVADTGFNHGLTDDKKYLIEQILQLAASLPSDSPSLQTLTSKFIESLWNNLEHPPLSYLGDEWRYRTADGSNNNRMMPQLGMAGSPYARTVRPKIQLPPTLPSPDLIFDEIYARHGKSRPHPNKISSMLPYLASIIIHDIFRTAEGDWNKVGNSSYLDLSPLYGNSDKEQKRVRTGKDGLLHPDTFSEVRLLGFPPGVCLMLVSFNRFHNYIAKELADINEAGRFTAIPEEDFKRLPPEVLKKYANPEEKRDNDLFQTARLITCGLYINIILIDYVRSILNLNTTHTEWSLDPRANVDKVFGETGVPDGIGNQVSVEFNLVYRWHSTISDRDEAWTHDFLKNEIGIDPLKFGWQDLRGAFRVWFEKQTATEPPKRTFSGLKRGPDGAFKDEDLINILTSSVEDVCGGFGARNVPPVMKVVEILGMQQARNWNVATLNEFRKFFGMIPHKEFSDISSNPDVAQSLETLYGHPDFVELYPGLVAEDAKQVMEPGSGLCPGFTISRAILADAVALVRGDRFYTIDYTAATLTNWGFNEVAPNKQIAGGGVMYKLFNRAFPGFFRTGSVYAMYPFTVPERTFEIVQSLGKEKDYDFTKPRFIPAPPEIVTWKAVVNILNDQHKFLVPWGKHTKYLTGHGYMLSGDAPQDAEQKAFFQKALYSPAHGMEDMRKLYEKITMDLILERGRKLRGGFQIDLVADVANLSHAICIAKMFHIPIKMPGDTDHILTPQAFYTILAVLFAYVFLDADSTASFQLRKGAKESTEALGKIVEAVVTLVQHEHFTKLKEWFGWGSQSHELPEEYGIKLIKRLSEGGKSADEVTWAMIPTMAASVATQAQGLSQMMDLFLSDEYYKHWPAIQKLALSNDPAAYATLEKYALEAYRLATPAFGLLRVVEPSSVTINDSTDKEPVSLKHGDQLFVNFVKAGLDPNVFPDPLEIKLDRDPALYIHHGHGPHTCLGRTLTVTAMAAQLKVLGRLKNLHRAPGPQGRMKSKLVNGAFKVYMTPDWSGYWPFPTTMKVHYDGIA